MTDPTVCCVMLTKDRPEMAARAIECFRKQTYPSSRRHMLILDTGSRCLFDFNVIEEYDNAGITLVGQNDDILSFRGATLLGGFQHDLVTIGALRNRANLLAVHECGADILIHWDDDDWSHPARIKEQVAILQASNYDAVGYREMLFW